MGDPPEAGRAARDADALSGSSPGCSSCRSCSARPPRPRPGAGRASPSRTPRSSSRAGWSSADGLVVTTNDSGDTGRVFTVDPATGETVGVTGWADDPQDVEALAPLGDRRGVGRRHRRQRRAAGLDPGGAGARGCRRRPASTAPVYDLAYPDGPHDAETLLVRPGHGPALHRHARTSSAGRSTRRRPTSSRDRRNQLEPRRRRAAGRHRRRLLPRRQAPRDPQLRRSPRSTPSRRWRRSASSSCPTSRRARGIAVDADGTAAAQLGGAALRGAPGVAARRARASPTPGASPSASPSDPHRRPSTHTESREGSELPETTETQRPAWPWFLGGLVGLGCLVVLTRSLRRR